jgi:hypothetical protein
MFEHFYISVRLYGLTSIAFIVTLIMLINSKIENNLIVFITIISFFLTLFLILFFKNLIYFLIAIQVRKNHIEKITKETKILNEKDFKDYIQNKKDLDMEGFKDKDKLNFLIKEIVYKRKFNEKSIAQSIFDERYSQ